MADSRWRVGAFVSLRTFARSDAEVANILEWFMVDKIDPMPDGLTQAEQNQWKLDQAHNEVIRYVVREAKRNRANQLRAQQTVEEQAENETRL